MTEVHVGAQKDPNIEANSVRRRALLRDVGNLRHLNPVATIYVSRLHVLLYELPLSFTLPGITYSALVSSKHELHT